MIASAARPVVLIDGGSGSGKTSLAQALTWAADVQVVGLDSCYPGWDGLAAASAIVPHAILRADGPHYYRWDWTADAPAERVELHPHRPLIVEGCGALTPASRRLATFAIWCELDEATRKARALARDGEVFARQWERWEAQEAAHWVAHRPWELADVVWDGAGSPLAAG